MSPPVATPEQLTDVAVARRDVLAAGGVVLDADRQVDRVGDPVRHVVAGAAGMRERVRDAERSRGRRCDRQRRGDQHVAARRDVVGLVHGALEVGADQPQRVQRAGVAVRVPLARDVPLDRVGHRVHAGRRGDRGRQRGGRRRIEDRQPRDQREIGDLDT